MLENDDSFTCTQQVTDHLTPSVPNSATRGQIPSPFQQQRHSRTSVFDWICETFPMIPRDSASVSSNYNGQIEIPGNRTTMDVLAGNMYSENLLQGNDGRWVVPQDRKDERTAVSAFKRRAASPLSKEPAKKAKTIYPNNNGDEKDPTEVIDENVDDASSAKTATTSLEQRMAERAAEIENLKEELESLKEELEESQSEKTKCLARAIEAEEEVEELRKAQNGKGKGSAAQKAALIQKVESEAKAKCGQKLLKQKEDFTARIEKLRESHQEAMDDLRAKQSKEQKAKDAALAKKKAELDAKMDHNRYVAKKKVSDAEVSMKMAKEEFAQLKKQLRAEQLEEIKKARPETNAVVKEKNEEIKELEKKVKELEKRRDSAKAFKSELEMALGLVEKQRNRLREDIYEHEEEIREMKHMLQLKDEQNSSLHEQQRKEHEEYQMRLEYERKKWQLQYDGAQKAKVEQIQTQRTVFALRTSLDARDQRIKEQQTAIAELKANCAAFETSAQSATSDRVLGKDGDADSAVDESGSHG